MNGDVQSTARQIPICRAVFGQTGLRSRISRAESGRFHRKKDMCVSDKLHHLGCYPEQLGRYVFLPGDPGRASLIAKQLEHAERIAVQREFVTYTGTLDGVPVSVTSTGIGGPSAAIAMEELSRSGAHTFVRVGTCGGIQETLLPGTLIIPTAAIRKDGTAREYLPLSFPAAANFDLVLALRSAAEKLGYPNRVGIVECKDSYYGQHDPESMPVCRELQEQWQMWKRAGALASEMESSALFVVAAVRGVRCATVLLLVSNHERSFAPGEPQYSYEIDRAIDTAVLAMRRQIAQDRTGDRVC